MLPDRVSNPGPLTYESGASLDGNILRFANFILSSALFYTLRAKHLKPRINVRVKEFSDKSESGKLIAEINCVSMIASA